MQPSQKVTIERIVDDWMGIFPLKGVGGKHLRSICFEFFCKKGINEGDLDGINGFEFENGYKYHILLHI